MRALSLHRPWPYAFLQAGKHIENRSHEITYRGDVVFQAAKKFDASAVSAIQRIEYIQMRSERTLKPMCSGLKWEHPAGVLSFVGEIVDCVRREEADDLAARGIVSLYATATKYHIVGADTVVDDMETKHKVEWNTQTPWIRGPWCAVVLNIRPLPAIPWKGAQGWFDVPDDVIAEALRS